MFPQAAASFCFVLKSSEAVTCASRIKADQGARCLQGGRGGGGGWHLAHGPAEDLPHAVRPSDEVGGAADEGADGRSQALQQSPTIRARSASLMTSLPSATRIKSQGGISKGLTLDRQNVSVVTCLAIPLTGTPVHISHSVFGPQ